MGAEHMGGREQGRSKLLEDLRRQLIVAGVNKKTVQAAIDAVENRTGLGESMVTAWLSRPGTPPQEFGSLGGRKGF